jgi:hydrogenase nickel incorporation protein HypA/HybF
VHELSVCLSLLDQLEKLAAEHDDRRITGIELDIGPLSGIEPDLLENAWPIAAADSIADSAELKITEADIVVRCSICNAQTAASANKLVCGACGDFRTNLVSGDEMILRRVEFETG